MPLFSWIGKEKVVNHDKEVSFRLLRGNKSIAMVLLSLCKAEKQ